MCALGMYLQSIQGQLPEGGAVEEGSSLESPAPIPQPDGDSNDPDR